MVVLPQRNSPLKHRSTVTFHALGGRKEADEMCASPQMKANSLLGTIEINEADCSPQVPLHLYVQVWKGACWKVVRMSTGKSPEPSVSPDYVPAVDLNADAPQPKRMPRPAAVTSGCSSRVRERSRSIRSHSSGQHGDAAFSREDTEVQCLRTRLDELEALHEAVPALRDLQRFLSQELPSLHGSGTLHQIPVLAIRWTHDTIDGRGIFLHGEYKAQSIYKLVDSIFRGEKAIEELDEPLDIVRYEGNLYCLRNRRCTAFSLVQGTRRDELVQVPCHLFDLGRGERDSQGEDVDRKFWKAFTGQSSKGRRIELRWMGHQQNLPLHNHAPLFGVAPLLKGLPASGSRYEQQVRSLHTRHPEMDVKTLLRLKQRCSSTAHSEFSFTGELSVRGGSQ